MIFSTEKMRWAQNHFFCAIRIFSLNTDMHVYEFQQLQNSYKPNECAERHTEKGKKTSRFWRVHWFFFFLFSNFSTVANFEVLVGEFVGLCCARACKFSLFQICNSIRRESEKAEQKEKENEHWIKDSNIIIIWKNCRIYLLFVQMYIEMGNFKCGRIWCMCITGFLFIHIKRLKTTHILIFNVFDDDDDDECFECKEIYYNLCKILNVNFLH